jgi:alpha-glucosidase/alpha-D-xyloside xylohydrolase
MLVAPVVEPGATNRRVYLPQGRWYDFWTSEAVDGGREVTRAVDLETMPIYVRAGAVLPMTDVAQTTAGSIGAPLTFAVYPGVDGACSVFEDDGRSFDYRRGGWMGIDAAWNDGARTLTLRSTPGSRPPASPRAVTVRMAGHTAVTARFTGDPLVVRL